MTMRTTEKTVSFAKSFILGGFDEVLPAGTYEVETDEELLEGLSFPAYRRVLTLIHLPAMPGHPGLTRTLTIDPNELDAALMRDEVSATVPVTRDASQKVSTRTTMARQEETDRQAVDRAEDEGMIVRPGHGFLGRNWRWH